MFGHLRLDSHGPRVAAESAPCSSSMWLSGSRRRQRLPEASPTGHRGPADLLTSGPARRPRPGRHTAGGGPRTGSRLPSRVCSSATGKRASVLMARWSSPGSAPRRVEVARRLLAGPRRMAIGMHSLSQSPPLTSPLTGPSGWTKTKPPLPGKSQAEAKCRTFAGGLATSPMAHLSCRLPRTRDGGRKRGGSQRLTRDDLQRRLRERQCPCE